MWKLLNLSTNLSNNPRIWYFQEFVGSSDRDTIVNNTFVQPVIARYIRVYPTAWVNYITMRWDITGCKGTTSHLNVDIIEKSLDFKYMYIPLKLV